MSNNLSETQLIILDILAPVYKYIQIKNMEYYMLGGTLLGAIRHKGFIPWDDDIDIGIPRSQYEKFIEEIQDYIPDHFRLETYINTESHHYYFSRIVDTRYSLKRTGSIVERTENVWIDIFPLDGMPNNVIIRKIHMFKLLILRILYHISCFEKVNLKRPNRPLLERIIIKFILFSKIGRNGNTKQKLKQIDQLLKKYPLENSNYIVNFMGQYKFKEMFPKAWYGTGELYRFENYLLNGPVNYNSVLTQQYGDYMTPPKVTERNTHATELNRQ